MKRLISLFAALALGLLPASAQMMTLTGAGLGAAGGAAPTITLTASARVSQVSTTCTFTSTNIGTASASRRVIVGAGTDNGGADVTAVDIGGTAASQVVQVTGGDLGSELWIAHVTTGTSVTITVTAGTAANSCSIGVWDAQNLTSDTAVDTGADADGDISDTLTTAVGVGVGMLMAVDVGGGSPTVAWTGLTENFESPFSSDFVASGASVVTTAGSLAITSTLTGTLNEGAVVIATFQ